MNKEQFEEELEKIICAIGNDNSLRPKGKWKFESGYFKCSKCGKLSFNDEVGSVGFDYKFCPYCGDEKEVDENG